MKYFSPEVEIIRFKIDDVLSDSSGGPNNPPGGLAHPGEDYEGEPVPFGQ